MLVLNLITFLHLSLLFIILFFRKDNVLPNKVLAILLFTPALNFIANVITLGGYIDNFPFFYFFSQSTAMLFAPLVHLYILLLIGKKINLIHPLHWISLINIIFIYFIFFQFYSLSKAEQEDYLFHLQEEPFPLDMTIFNSIFILMQQFYFSIAAWEVYQYRKRLKKHFSSLTKTKIGFAARFIILIWALNFLTIFSYVTLPSTLVEYIGLPVVMSIIFGFILYFGFEHHSIFTKESYDSFLTTQQEITKTTSPDHVQIPVDDDLIELSKVLTEHLNTSKSFQKQDLDLSSLATELNVSTGKLSNCINKVLHKTFYDMINEYRVAQSLLLIKEKPFLTIEGIAYESGFNSRASFYRAFKKIQHETPTEYMKRHKL